MSTIAGTTQGTRSCPSRQDSSAGNVTRSLLGYLALAGPFYVVVSLAQHVFASGMNVLFVVGAAAVLAGALVSFAAVRSKDFVAHGSTDPVSGPDDGRGAAVAAEVSA